MLQLTTPESSSKLESLSGIALDAITQKTITAQTVNATSTTPDLFAVFSKSTIEDLLAVPNCVGIRLYPAIKENELVVIAGCVDAGNNDLVGTNALCGCGYSHPSVESHTQSIPDSRNMVLAKNDPDTPEKQNLRTLQNVSNSPLTFKAIFDREFFNQNFGTSNSVRFDVCEITFNGNGQTFRTFSAMFLNSPSLSIHASLLPCPPYCGAGGYLAE